MKSMKFFFAGVVATAMMLGTAQMSTATAQDLYLVSFTADWCPNCVILDPKLEAAMEEVEDDVEHLVLDMTDAETRGESFEQVSGTVLAEVYGDHLGVTGIGILTAADSGEKLGCVDRTHSTQEIVDMLQQALYVAQNETALARSGGIGKCPRSNRKVDIW